MRQSKRSIAALLILVLVAFVVWRDAFDPKRNREKTTGSLESIKEFNFESATQDLLTLMAKRREESLRDKSGWLRNPFYLPAEHEEERRKSLMLEGVFWDETSPSAIMMGTVVKVGDKVGNYTVLEIHQDKVLVDDGTEKVILEIKK